MGKGRASPVKRRFYRKGPRWAKPDGTEEVNVCGRHRTGLGQTGDEKKRLGFAWFWIDNYFLFSVGFSCFRHSCVRLGILSYLIHVARKVRQTRALLSFPHYIVAWV
jgi:hypothetical protein